MTNQNDSAFPIMGEIENTGLTKREYIATQILKGLLEGRNEWEFDHGIKYAIEVADKFIAALNQTDNGTESGNN